MSDPAAMAGQPARCGAHGSPRVSANQVRTSGWKRSRASDSGMQRFDAWRVRGEPSAHHLNLDGDTHRWRGGSPAPGAYLCPSMPFQRRVVRSVIPSSRSAGAADRCVDHRLRGRRRARLRRDGWVRSDGSQPPSAPVVAGFPSARAFSGVGRLASGDTMTLYAIRVGGAENPCVGADTVRFGVQWDVSNPSVATITPLPNGSVLVRAQAAGHLSDVDAGGRHRCTLGERRRPDRVHLSREPHDLQHRRGAVAAMLGSTLVRENERQSRIDQMLAGASSTLFRAMRPSALSGVPPRPWARTGGVDLSIPCV